MSSKTVRKVTSQLRELQGTPAGHARDRVLGLVGMGLSGYDRLSKRFLRKAGPHPLFRILAAQTGDPFDEWTLDNLPLLRRKFEGQLDFMPKDVPGKATLRNGAGQYKTPVIEIVPDVLRDDERIVYLHGGGFVLGSASSVLPEAAALAQELGRRTYVVEYPLAPESRLDVTAAAVSEAIAWATEGKTFSLVGESAGAYLGLRTLLTNASLNSKCRNVVCFYPFLDLRVDSSAVEKFNRGFLLSQRILEWFVSCALPVGQSVDDWLLQDSHGSVSARVLVIVGEFDPLLRDVDAVAANIQDLTVEVAPGLMHGFMQIRGLLPERDLWLKRCVRFLR